MTGTYKAFLKGCVLFLLTAMLVLSFCACSQGENASAAVTKVTLNKSSITLTSGDSYQLIATASPEGASQDFSWKSSSNTYATVTADGLVKVKNTGNKSASVTITATSKADSSKKATCTITVKVAPPAAFTLSKTGMVTSGPGEDASREAVISWHSPTKGTSLEFSDANGSDFIHTVDNSDCSEVLSTANWADTAAHYRCRVVLDGLTPGSTYKYRIKDADGSYTATAQFRTAESDTTNFNFMWLSDNHVPDGGTSTLDRIKELITFAKNKPDVDPDFVLFTGDMVNKGQIYRHWNYWSTSGLMSDMTYAFVCGNHDYYPYGSKDRTTNAYYKDVCAYPFNYSEDGKTVLDSNYWFIWNRVLFVCVDNFTSEGSETKTKSGSSFSDQLAWFKAVVEANAGDYDYLIYAQHLPFFDTDTEPCDYGYYDEWYKTFDLYKVDFALSSDEHTYRRSYPLLNDAKVDLVDGKVASGTVYVVSNQTEGTSISKLDNEVTSGSKYVQYTAGGIGGVYFTVTPTEMTLHLIGSGGREYDTITVAKKSRD